MDINSITIGQFRELTAMFAGTALVQAQAQPTYVEAVQGIALVEPQEDLSEGLCICVLDKGFVYVGDLTIDGNGKLFTISNAKNIRRWGTKNGLGELAEAGPQENTTLDPTGTVRALTGELKHWIQCRSAAWK